MPKILLMFDQQSRNHFKQSAETPPNGRKTVHTTQHPDTVRVTLLQLLKRKKTKPDWIIEGLIHAGDQVVLAGPPKIGKSILGFQLALAVAEGGKRCFLSERFKTKSEPRKVLVFSLEMKEPMVSERLAKLYPDKQARERARNMKLQFIFRVAGDSSLDVVDFDRDTESKAKKAGTASLSHHGRVLQQIISKAEPDLVVFDTLIRMHALDENNNVAMSHLLKFIRKICTLDERPLKKERKKSKNSKRPSKRHPVELAHVLIHHTRKESNIGNGSANRDANAVRGAGAIHSEADLVLTLSEWDRNGVLMMSTSARRVEVPNEIFLERKNLEFHSIVRPIGTRETKAGELAKALWGAFQSVPPGEDGLGMQQIVERVNERGYADLTPDNFRKTYVGKVLRFLTVKEPKKGDTDKVKRYRLNPTATEADFYAALNARIDPRGGGGGIHLPNNNPPPP